MDVVKENKNISSTYVVEDNNLDIEKLSNYQIKVPIAQVGSWQHEAYGLVEFTKEDLNQVVKNFNDEVLGFNSYLTYGHPKPDASFSIKQSFLEEAEAIDAARKKGNLESLAVDNEILYGIYSTNSETLESIDKGEYEYSSGEFLYDFKDKSTGENRGTVLVRTALTNSPFIPLKDKVKVFSQNSKKDLKNPHSTLDFIIKLSKSVDAESKRDSLLKITAPEKLVNNMSQETVITPEADEQSVTSPIDKNKDDKESKEIKVESLLPTEVTTSSVEIKPQETSKSLDKIKEISEEKKEVKLNNPTDWASEIKTITDSLTKNFKADLDNTKESYQSTIDELKNQISELTQSVNKQQIVANKFSENISKAEKVAKANALATKGISPALIQRYSLLANSILTNSSNNVIKLSTTVENGKNVETESDLLTEIENLLVDAVNTQPVNLQRYGQTFVSESTISTGLRDIAKANIEKAKKLQLK